MEVPNGFEEIFSLPSIHGAIDVIQIHIKMPQGPFIRDYFCYDLTIHNGKLWLIVRRNFGMFVGLFGSMNDAKRKKFASYQ